MEGFKGRNRGKKKRASTSSFVLLKPLKPWEDRSQGTDWYSRAIKCRMACQATDRSPGLIERIFHSDEFLSSLSDEFLAGAEAKIPLPSFSSFKGNYLSRFSSRGEKKRTPDCICDFSFLIFNKKIQ